MFSLSELCLTISHKRSGKSDALGQCPEIDQHAARIAQLSPYTG